MSADEKERLTQGSRSQTHRESITERSAGGPVAGVTRTRSRTRLLSAAVVQSLGRKIRVVSVGCRSVENGGVEKV